MVKLLLKTCFVILLSFSYAFGNDYTCRSGLVTLFIDEKRYCLNSELFAPKVNHLYPQQWERDLERKLNLINPQPEPPGKWDIQILSMMALLADKLSPELKENFFAEINWASEEVLPHGVRVGFEPARSRDNMY